MTGSNRKNIKKYKMILKRPITRSRAKKLQRQVNSLLTTFDASITEKFILPKCSTLIVLRYTHEEKEHDRATRMDHQIGPPKETTITLESRKI